MSVVRVLFLHLLRPFFLLPRNYLPSLSAASAASRPSWQTDEEGKRVASLRKSERR